MYRQVDTFGRIGNFIGGELYGRPVTDPNFALGMIFPTDPLQLIRHPSQLYQAFCEGLSCLLYCGGLVQSHVHAWQYQPYS